MSTKKGTAFELQIYEYFQSLILSGDLGFIPECCKIYHHKKYYSQERKGDIIFDVAIEIYRPGAADFSILYLIECKDHSKPVEPGDAAKLSDYMRQVGSAKTKGVIVTTSSFASGTLESAKSQGIGLVRYFSPTDVKWELQRSPSANYGSTSTSDTAKITQALSIDSFESFAYNFYMQSTKRLTNSLYDFFKDLALDSGLSQAEFKQISKPPKKYVTSVKYRGKVELELYGVKLLDKINYSGGRVALEDLIALADKKYGLQVRLNSPRDTTLSESVLGRITFGPDVIEVFEHDPNELGRARFTLAHELSHSLLVHGRYLIRELCDINDLTSPKSEESIGPDVLNMEVQANFLASCILMPAPYLSRSLHTLLNRFGIRKGIVPLYVDFQPCNLQTFNTIISHLTDEYAVSQTALCIRLEYLKLLRDDRSSPKHISKYLSQNTKRPYRY